MVSKLVVDRQKSADSVIAVGDAHAMDTAEALAAVFKPHLKKGDALSAIASLITLTCATLGAAKDRMVATDEAHEAELADDAPLREERDRLSQQLYDQLVEAREILTGIYGAPFAQKILPGTTPQDPVVIARFAGEVAARLTSMKPPAPRVKGAKLDTADLAASLQDKRSQLEATFKAIQREVREAQASLAAKNEALAAYDETFTGVATTLTGLLRLAGKPDLAARVRPSTRRPGQTASDAGDTEDPAPTPDK